MSDQPSIGLILRQDNKRFLAEHELRGIDGRIGNCRDQPKTVAHSLQMNISG
jgi:hypothetical protein